MRRVSLWIALCFGAFGCAFGCGSSEPSTDAGDDAPAVCRTDTDCSDGLFCNGEERCMPGDGADARGCRPGTMACPLRECDETTRTCGEACPDRDGDGAADVTCGGTDCDDDDPNVYPDATEICDAEGVDEDCDPSTVSGPEGDLDEDGFYAERCCNGDECGTDCNDEERAINPGSLDVCGGGDQDCDGSIDENPDETFYRDRDGDGFGIEEDTVIACSAPGGYAVIPGDCNDEQRNYNPSAPEECDGSIDEDCDGSVDEDCPCTPEGMLDPCDTDRAGVGICRAGNRVCTAEGWTGCLDSVVARAEECNADLRDENCDGTVDEGCECINGTTRRCGNDIGRCQSVLQTCVAGAWPRRCEDQAGVVNPTTEICNGGIDDDCDGQTDEGCACTNGTTRPCGTDVGACEAGSQTCNSGAWSTCVGAVGPTTELCNGRDDDCDGVPDNADLDIAGVGAVCGTDTGLCTRGTQLCNGTALVCGGTFVGPQPEGTLMNCDHQDQDCDGYFDEGAAQPTCMFISSSAADFDACLPSCPGSTTLRYRLGNAADETARAAYLDSRASVDWGSHFRVESLFRLTRSGTSTALSTARFGTVIHPTAVLGTEADAGLPRPSSPMMIGYAAQFQLNALANRVRLYRLTSGGPVEVAVSSSLPADCRLDRSDVADVVVWLESSYGRMTAGVSFERVSGDTGSCVFEQTTVTYTEPSWAASMYGETASYPRYEVGAVYDDNELVTAADLTSISVTRRAPVSVGVIRGDRGSCVACSW